MNSYMTGFSQANSIGSVASQAGFNNFSLANRSNNNMRGSNNKFERKQYEKGLFNVDERNREIDEAILMLKREEENDRIPYND